MLPITSEAPPTPTSSFAERECSDMAVATFLQISDLHLGRPFHWRPQDRRAERRAEDRKSTRLNSSHSQNSYAGFCLKKKDERQRLRRRQRPPLSRRTEDPQPPSLQGRQRRRRRRVRLRPALRLRLASRRLPAAQASP